MAVRTKASYDKQPPIDPKGKGGRPSHLQVVTRQLSTYLPNFADSGLSVREGLFAVDYATNGFDAAKAYKKTVDARITDINAEAQAQLMLTDLRIRQAVNDIVTLWVNEKKLKLEREVIQVLYAQAFYDPAMFMSLDGSPKFSSWDDIPPIYRPCVESIETKLSPSGHSTVIIKLVDRKWAIDRLQKMIGSSLTQVPIDSQLRTGQINQTNNFIMSGDASTKLTELFANNPITNPPERIECSQ